MEYRGMDGNVALGGLLSGAPVLFGALAEFDTTMSVDAVSLVGSLVAGDRFTITGEAGTPIHTVTGGPVYVAAANVIAGVTFTPAIAAGGVADGAAVTVLANAVLQVRSWSLTAALEELDATVMGDAWRNVVGGEGSWQAGLEVLLDYSDPRQARLIDALSGAVPPAIPIGMTLVVQRSSVKGVSAAGILRNVQVGAQRGQLIPATFDVAGDGNPTLLWD